MSSDGASSAGCSKTIASGASAIAVAVIDAVWAELASDLETDISGSEERALRSLSASKGDTGRAVDDELAELPEANGEGARGNVPLLNGVTFVAGALAGAADTLD
jgi:hypothetical protein